MKFNLSTEIDLADARQRGMRNAHARQTRLFPEHLPRILARRKEGESWAKIGKRWGVGGEAVRAFVLRMEGEQ